MPVKILMICGVFSEAEVPWIMTHGKRPVEFSANRVQQKLLQGLQPYQPIVISAPFIGSWPDKSDIFLFRGLPREPWQTVPFCNVWGLRNFSRTYHLKKALGEFIRLEEDQKLILVYNTHTPFLEAAAWAKKQDPRIKICLYAADLPQYMNLRTGGRFLYDLLKPLDIARMGRFLKDVDAFVVLTRQMKDKLAVGNRPCLVREGIVEENTCPEADVRPGTIVYTGKLDAAFGIPTLLEAFSRLEGEGLSLVLCGSGDCHKLAAETAQKDPRIRVLGQVSPEEVALWQRRAAVLVNPRLPEGEYTRYSFPSKLLEYLDTGRPVAAFYLEGMPACYRDLLFTPEETGNPAQTLTKAMETALRATPEEMKARREQFRVYSRETLRPEAIGRAIINLCFPKTEG